MTANGRILITINANCGDDEFLLPLDLRSHSRVVAADAIVTAVEHSNLSVLELRIVVPSQHAEDLVLGMVQGDTEIAIGKMSPVVEFQ